MSAYDLYSTEKANEALAAIGGTGMGQQEIDLLKQIFIASAAGSGSSFDPASPGPIGGTTPAAGSFTDLTASGVVTFSKNGALSQPTLALIGTPVTGGSSTTTKPLALIETTGATSTGWSTAGTMYGINAPSGFTGNLIDAQLNGVSKFKVDAATGKITYGDFSNSIGSSVFGFVEIQSANQVVAGFWSGGGMVLPSSRSVIWTDGTLDGTRDLFLNRSTSGILKLTADGSSAGAALEGFEQTAPAAPAANGYRLFAQDNGAGKTQLMVIFASGAAQQIAIEP